MKFNKDENYSRKQSYREDLEMNSSRYDLFVKFSTRKMSVLKLRWFKTRKESKLSLFDEAEISFRFSSFFKKGSKDLEIVFSEPEKSIITEEIVTCLGCGGPRKRQGKKILRESRYFSFLLPEAEVLNFIDWAKERIE